MLDCVLMSKWHDMMPKFIQGHNSVTNFQYQTCMDETQQDLCATALGTRRCSILVAMVYCKKDIEPLENVQNIPKNQQTFGPIVNDSQRVKRIFGILEFFMKHPNHTSLIHSYSAGVGRTGSFCCIYSAIREMQGENGLSEFNRTLFVDLRCTEIKLVMPPKSPKFV